MTDAAEIRTKSQMVSQKSGQFHDLILAATLIVDDIQELVVGMGFEAPLVLPTIELVLSNLKTSNNLISQVEDAVESWAMKL
jgi:hypothetical protein